MIGRLRLVTDAAAEPVALSDVAAYCRVDDIASNTTVLTGLITAARKRVEKETGLALLTQTWTYVLDGWPGSPPGRSIATEWWDGVRDGSIAGLSPSPVIEIPKRPFQSVTTMQLRDYTGVFSTVSPTIYYTEASNDTGRVIRNPTVPWPVVILAPSSAIEITFKCGYADAQGGITPKPVPGDLLTAVNMLTAHWFENREPMSGGRVAQLPYHVQDIMQLYRNVRL